MPRVLCKTEAIAFQLFWNKVNQAGADECWLFIAKSRAGSLGYGAVKFMGRMILAHRVAFYASNGYWPTNTRHTCDTPLCCNPAHLLSGTQLENVQDCVARGRARNGNIKLNPEAWEEIRTSNESSSILAKRFSVCSAHIRSIRRGRTGRYYRP